MNHEEKILEILSQIQTDVSGLKQDVSNLKTDVSDLKQDVSTLKLDMTDVKQELTDVKQELTDVKQELTVVRTTQENKVVPHIRILAEGLEINRRHIPDETVIEDMQADIDILKKAVAQKANIV